MYSKLAQSMKFTLASTPATRLATRVLFLPVFQGDAAKPRLERSEGVVEVDQALNGVLSRAAEEEGFAGKTDQHLQLHTHGNIRAAQVVLLGLGKRKDLEPEAVRISAGRASKIAAKLRAGDAAFWLSDLGNTPEMIQAIAEGFVLGDYRFDRYRTTADAKSRVPLTTVTLSGSARARGAQKWTRAVEAGRRIAEATNWARDLVNEPAAVLTPKRLAEEARRAAKQGGAEIRVGGRREIEKLRMGMFSAVAQGSDEEPRFIQLRYRPKSPKDARRPPLALVGKAITFDSGGLSLKSAEGMVDMKTDMAGSAAVLATMSLMDELAPPFPVHAFIGACENMPSGKAYRPGDVLISRLGKSVEVTNTDAEGRLVLGDMLAFANEERPAAIIDLATLTGACVVALGNYITGVFTANDELADEVLQSAERAGEPMWRMPISDLQKDALRSEIADMKNSGERWGGAINAALFLREFTGDAPWVHLDIAGPSWSPKERGYFNKGATGVGVRTLVELIEGRAKQARSSEKSQ